MFKRNQTQHPGNFDTICFHSICDAFFLLWKIWKLFSCRNGKWKIWHFFWVYTWSLSIFRVTNSVCSWIFLWKFCVFICAIFICGGYLRKQIWKVISTLFRQRDSKKKRKNLNHTGELESAVLNGMYNLFLLLKPSKKPTMCVWESVCVFV